MNQPFSPGELVASRRTISPATLLGSGSRGLIRTIEAGSGQLGRLVRDRRIQADPDADGAAMNGELL